MKLSWTPKIIMACVVLSLSSLSLAYASGGYAIPAAVVIVTGMLWLLDYEQRWNHLASIVLVLFTLFCVFGYWMGLYLPLLVLSLTAALAAWDLDHFSRRVLNSAQVKHLDRMEKQHIQSLLLVCGVGLLIAEGTLLVQIQLSFWASFAAALVVLFGLTWAIALIRRNA
jgi:hypothetical protein